ncbi:MAG TPA: DoxX family protein [Xanthobacteraceae bacterium]|nr:DoxX family protein [Xanthobacteraceae bacterium]
MPRTTPEGQKLFIPALAPFYGYVTDLSWLIVRLTAGLMLLPHGIPKWQAGVAAFATGSLARRGIEPSLPLAYLVVFVEIVGGVCIALGLFTRFFAAAAAIHLCVVMFVHMPQGFGWAARGYEYPLFWGLILFAIALRGGGPYSLDRKIGREL